MEELKKQLQEEQTKYEMLKTLDLPLNESRRKIRLLEEKYVRKFVEENIIPLIQDDLDDMMEGLKNQFSVDLHYVTGKDITTIVETQIVESDFGMLYRNFGFGHKTKLCVEFPDGKISCHNKVVNTFMDVIKYAGAQRVKELGIRIAKDNLITDYLREKYPSNCQKEVENGFFVFCVSSTKK